MLRRLSLLLVLLASTVTLSSCDLLLAIFFPDTITFEGVTYAAVGEARLSVENDRLVVSNIGDSGDDGVRVSTDEAIQLADIRTLPVDIPDEGRWGMQLFGFIGGARTALATVWSEAIDAELHRIEFDYAPELGVETVTLEYYLDRDLVLRVPGVPTASAAAGSTASASGAHAARAAGAGTSGDDPRSVHVVLINGVYVVSTDYGGGAPRSGCPGTVLQLSFPDAPSELCTDFIQAVPEKVEAFPAGTSLEVRARTLEEFAIEDGDLQ